MVSYLTFTGFRQNIKERISSDYECARLVLYTSTADKISVFFYYLIS